MKRLTPKCMRIFKTCNLYLCFLGLGMCIAVPGPALLDLQSLVNTDTQHIAFIYTARSIGYAVGSVIGGIILDAVKSKQAVMTIFIFLAGITMLGIPWSKNIGTLAGFMIVNGFSLGTTDTGGNVICLTLWGSESGPYFQALHFTFGFGGLVSPLIAAPFLGAHRSEDNMLMNKDNETNSLSFSNFTTALLNNNSDATNATWQSLPKIIYPFTAIGLFCLIVTILFLAVTILAPTEDGSTRTENVQEANRGYGLIVTLVILIFLLAFVEAGTEIGYAQMLTTYVVKGPLQLSSSTGSYMTSIFWASFSAARLITVFLAIKFSNFTLIVSDIVITAVGSAVLLFLSSYEWSVWLSSVLLGAGIASFWPAAVGWMDTYINVTNKIVSIFTVGAAVGEMVIPFTISYFIERVPEVLIYVVPASSVLSAILVFILYMILRKREKRVVSQNPPSSVDCGLKTTTTSA